MLCNFILIQIRQKYFLVFYYRLVLKHLDAPMKVSDRIFSCNEDILGMHRNIPRFYKY